VRDPGWGPAACFKVPGSAPGPGLGPAARPVAAGAGAGAKTGRAELGPGPAACFEVAGAGAGTGARTGRAGICARAGIGRPPLRIRGRRRDRNRAGHPSLGYRVRRRDRGRDSPLRPGPGPAARSRCQVACLTVFNQTLKNNQMFNVGLHSKIIANGALTR